MMLDEYDESEYEEEDDCIYEDVFDKTKTFTISISEGDTKIRIVKHENGPIKKNIIGSYSIIGFDHLLLEQEYDPRQMWLPFVYAIIKNMNLEPEKFRKMSSNLIKLKIEKPYCEISNRDKRMYFHEKGVNQLCLPFIEHKIVIEDEWEQLKENDFPGWERFNGQLIKFTLKPYSILGKILKSKEPGKTIREWLLDNCHGRFYIKGRNIKFELAIDFAMTKIGFS